jgi:hypothetical protein
MILQPSQARVCSGSQNLETSSRGAQLESDIAQLKEALRQRQQIGLTTDLLAQRLAITPERGWMVAVDADEENSGVAESKLRIVEDQP